ncbi:MAG: hypothetical protein GF353_23540 [Candidatus Lokiarchaeota archaeon]|nr:hypothetical protein [Candidatus Lokiarchaeota archaeon]
MSKGKRHTFTIGIFGQNFKQNNLIGQALGAPDSSSDIQVYSRYEENLGYTFMASTPIGYPDKIKPMLQILRLASIHLLVIDLDLDLDSLIGEILVGIDLKNQLHRANLIVVISNITSTNEWKLAKIKKQIHTILNTTSLKESKVIELKTKQDYDNLKKLIIETGLENPQYINHEPQYAKVLIDSAFPVKGIGTVILGIVESGLVKVGQLVEIHGYEDGPKKVIIRSIQKQDRNFKTAEQGDRIGFALKGNISAKDIKRDNIIVTPGIFKSEKKIIANVYISPFYKPKGGSIKPGDDTQYHAMVDLKSSAFKFSIEKSFEPGQWNQAVLNFEKFLAHDGSGLKGIITEMNKFNNKLRIVGMFNQIMK